MGWFPVIVENKSVKKMASAFYSDLMSFINLIRDEQKHSADKYGELPELYYNTVSAKELTLDRECMEYIGRLLHDRRLRHLFKKYKVTGTYFIYHTDGVGYHDGLRIVDGHPTVITTGN
jgi:hypothetical protein